MKKNKLLIFLTIVLMFTVFGGVLHFSTRDNIPEDALKITYQEKEIFVDIHTLETEYISGTRINGKNEEISVEGPAVLVKNLFTKEKIKTFRNAKFISDDSYSAEVTYEEIVQKENVYLLYEMEEDTLRLVVFGDKNSKRNVSNVVEIEIK